MAYMPKIGEWAKFNLVSYTGCKLIRYSKVDSIKPCDHIPGFACYSKGSCAKCPSFFINHYAAYKVQKLNSKEKQAIALYLVANKGDIVTITKKELTHGY